MDPINPLPVIAAVILAVAAAQAASTFSPRPSLKGRFESIDGLRGYLALAVFLHHSCIWFFYLRTGKWEAPPSHLYTHLGQTSVALFFMITSFLFFTKVLDSKNNPIDWERLYIGRAFRLFPLYAFMLILLLVIVGVLSHGTLQQAPNELLKALFRWITFTAFGAPTLNSVGETSRIVAGVTWSLPYEWFFYLSLPVIALLFNRPPILISMLGVASAIAFVAWRPNYLHVLSFAFGIATALLVRFQSFRTFASGGLAALVIFSVLTCAVLIFPSAYHPIPLTLIAVAFSLIAGGNTIYGALSSRASQTLGEMTYSIYLLHGIALFCMFTFVVDRDQAARLSAELHWGMILLLCPVLVLGCHWTFRLIEAPAVAVTGSAMSLLRKRTSRGTPPFRT